MIRSIILCFRRILRGRARGTLRRTRAFFFFVERVRYERNYSLMIRIHREKTTAETEPVKCHVMKVSLTVFVFSHVRGRTLLFRRSIETNANAATGFEILFLWPDSIDACFAIAVRVVLRISLRVRVHDSTYRPTVTPDWFIEGNVYDRRLWTSHTNKIHLSVPEYLSVYHTITVGSVDDYFVIVNICTLSIYPFVLYGITEFCVDPTIDIG